MTDWGRASALLLLLLALFALSAIAAVRNWRMYWAMPKHHFPLSAVNDAVLQAPHGHWPRSLPDAVLLTQPFEGLADDVQALYLASAQELRTSVRCRAYAALVRRRHDNNVAFAEALIILGSAALGATASALLQPNAAGGGRSAVVLAVSLAVSSAGLLYRQFLAPKLKRLEAEYRKRADDLDRTGLASEALRCGGPERGWLAWLRSRADQR